MQKRICEFPATYPNGTPETIVVYQDFRVHQSGRQSEEPGTTFLKTTKGQHVNQIVKGQYQVVETGERLSSDHANSV